jgi:hypothetical protein
MVKYHSYENWLKSKGYKTYNTYLSFMRQIEKDLGNIDLEQIKSISYLKKLMEEIKSRNTFAKRGESDKSNILSGFNTYIEFRKDTKRFLK